MAVWKHPGEPPGAPPGSTGLPVGAPRGAPPQSPRLLRGLSRQLPGIPRSSPWLPGELSPGSCLEGFPGIPWGLPRSSRGSPGSQGSLGGPGSQGAREPQGPPGFSGKRRDGFCHVDATPRNCWHMPTRLIFLLDLGAGSAKVKVIAPPTKMDYSRDSGVKDLTVIKFRWTK